MKAICLEAPDRIMVVEKDVPARKPNEAILRVKAAGICGSDIGAFRGTNPLVSYPRIIGHEIACEIIEIDENRQGLQKGDHVIVVPYLNCGICYPCSINRTNCCDRLQVLGVHIDGGMAEIITHPADMLVKVPHSMKWEHVPLAEPVTIALHAIHRAKLKASEKVVINGAGAIGLLIALCAIAYGAEPILVDIISERLKFAQALGIARTINIAEEELSRTVHKMTNGRMAEVVIEASGANSAIRSTLDIVAYAGRIVLTGWPKKETSLPTDLITKKELDVLGARTSAGEFEEAIELMLTGKVNAAAVLSKVVSFEEIPQIVREESEHPDRYLKVNAVF